MGVVYLPNTHMGRSRVVIYGGHGHNLVGFHAWFSHTYEACLRRWPRLQLKLQIWYVSGR